MPGPSTVTLSDFLGSMRRLLHDPNDAQWSLADKISYLNEALQQRDLDAGGQRALVTFALTAAQTNYSFTNLESSGTFVGVAAATANIFDIIGITLIYSGYRILLESYSYSEMVAYPGYLAYTQTSDRPAAWCRRGAQLITIAPAPTQAYSTEWDVLCYATPTLLAQLTDADPMPYPYTYPVPLYASYLAKQNERRFDDAAFFLNRYQVAITQINSAKTGMSPTMYPATALGTS